MTVKFDELGLSQPILQALELQNYHTPTPIQAQAIPPVLEGRDLLGIAQTGTGKTAAFMLPSIDRLRESDNNVHGRSCRMLVLAPTRELAGQIAQNAKDYASLSGMRVQCIFGGTSVNKDRQKLARGTDILVATPGRLIDLVEQRALVLNSTEILVLDEADQMLDLGFIHALRQIVKLVPDERQTLFFSATMPKQIKELVSKYCRNPVQVSVTPESKTADRVSQHVSLIQQAEKQALLTLMLNGQYEVEGKIDKVLIFTRTKHGADRVVRKLGQSDIRANAIHGNKSQPQRERALGEFRKGRVPILVATDIAARGIDVTGVSHVINYELPNVPEQYVHRIGRTARAGADGVAISFCAADERPYLRDIQRLTGVTLEKLELPPEFRSTVEAMPAEEKRPARGNQQGRRAQNGGGRGRGQQGGGQGGGNRSRNARGGGKPQGGQQGGDRRNDSGPVSNPVRVKPAHGGQGQGGQGQSGQSQGGQDRGNQNRQEGQGNRQGQQGGQGGQRDQGQGGGNSGKRPFRNGKPKGGKPHRGQGGGQGGNQGGGGNSGGRPVRRRQGGGSGPRG